MRALTRSRIRTALCAAAAACTLGAGGSASGFGLPWASEEPPQHVVRDPYYGDALFYFYQQRYFTSVTGLMVSQHFDRLSHHADASRHHSRILAKRRDRDSNKHRHDPDDDDHFQQRIPAFAFAHPRRYHLLHPPTVPPPMLCQGCGDGSNASAGAGEDAFAQLTCMPPFGSLPCVPTPSFTHCTVT